MHGKIIGDIRGFTLVELMVALAIGMIISLGAASALIAFGASRGRSLGDDAVLENSSVFLFSLAQEVKNSGLSPLDPNNTVVCTQYNFSSTDGTLLDGAAIYPVQIIDGGPTGSDEIAVAFTGSILGKSGTRLIADMPSAASDLQVASSTGFNFGDVITVGTSDGGSPCTVMQISAIAPAGPNATLSHAPGSGLPYNPADPSTQFSTAPAYPAGSLVFGSGGLSYVTYQVGANGLQVVDNLTRPAQVGPVADGVVFIKAQYGVSTGIGEPLQWVSAGSAPWNSLTPALAAQIRAIHVGLIVRNSQLIQPSVHGGQCDATTGTAPGSPGNPYLWPNGPTVDLAAALGANPNWACYKYRGFDRVIPLKNVLFQ
jgi:type IV pilus assembly protein PilW